MPFDHTTTTQCDDAEFTMRRRSQSLRCLTHDLERSLPPPPEDTPEARTAMLETAIDAIAGLVPCNDAEAKLAAQFVLADARATEALSAANEPGIDDEKRGQRLRWASSMLRQSQGAMRTLLRVQAERRKRESLNALAADAVERQTVRMMMQAVPRPAAPTPSPKPCSNDTAS